MVALNEERDVMVWMRLMAGVCTLALVMNASIGAGGARVSAQEGTKATAPAATVNLNTATAAELDRLPGLGPALVARILDYRQKNGGFKKIEDLMNVQGIGETSFLRLKPMVSVTPPTTAQR
jgi:competence protein ComEA